MAVRWADNIEVLYLFSIEHLFPFLLVRKFKKRPQPTPGKENSGQSSSDGRWGRESFSCTPV